MRRQIAAADPEKQGAGGWGGGSKIRFARHEVQDAKKKNQRNGQGIPEKMEKKQTGVRVVAVGFQEEPDWENRKLT